MKPQGFIKFLTLSERDKKDRDKFLACTYMQFVFAVWMNNSNNNLNFYAVIRGALFIGTILEIHFLNILPKLLTIPYYKIPETKIPVSESTKLYLDRF